MRFRSKDEIKRKEENPYLLTQEEIDKLLNTTIPTVSGLPSKKDQIITPGNGGIISYDDDNNDLDDDDLRDILDDIDALNDILEDDNLGDYWTF